MLDIETREAIKGVFMGVLLSLIMWPVIYFLILAWW